nr:MAG TPA: hypothetical protein [Caudoviricetes sp.]
MNILDYIPTGHKNAVSRRWLQITMDEWLASLNGGG